MKVITILCSAVLALPAGAQTVAPPSHWEQLDTQHRRSFKTLIADGFEMKAAFNDSYGREIAYLQKGARVFRCVVGGANLPALAENELLCSEFVEPHRTK